MAKKVGRADGKGSSKRAAAERAAKGRIAKAMGKVRSAGGPAALARAARLPPSSAGSGG